MTKHHPRVAFLPPKRFASSSTVAAAVLCLSLSAASGCQMTASRWLPGLPGNPFARVESSDTTTDTPPRADSDKPAANPFRRNATTDRLVGFVTGKNENLPLAKQRYQQGDALFRQATAEPKDKRVDLFAKAAKRFKTAGDAAPGSGLHQDALFMQGESLFFANDLNGARDAFETLQKEFPRNRHSDRAAARLFSIGQYWIAVSKAGGDSWYKLNLFDSKLPMRDADAHAVRVLDQIRFDDPTGKLADDATMAAAVEHLRNQRYEQADEFLTDLRETFTDSDHLFLAHMLGIRCKLEVYRGPAYSDLVLEEADELLKQTRQRFPNKLREQKYNETLARSAAEIDYHKAGKLAYRARIRGKQRNYGAARELYRQILRDHPAAPQAEEARKTLDKIASLPAQPDRPLAFMTKAFPSAKQSPPLELAGGESDTEEDSETPPEGDSGERMLR